MIRRIVVSLLPFLLCSCSQTPNKPTQLTPDHHDLSAEKDEKSEMDSELPDYIEVNGRIYRIHSMGSKTQNSGDLKDADPSSFSKNHEVHSRSKREITLIKSEKVPEQVVNFSRSNMTPISEFDSIAMQMVGKYVPESFRHDRVYYGYLKFFEREWARLEHNSLGHVHAWAVDNIVPKIPSVHDSLFYPFGGPDIAYALAFYPDAPEYILVGLEPIGRFKDLREAMRDSANFEQIKQSLSTYLRGGYFITSEMGKNLWDRWLRGTMYLILLELAACDFEISNVEEIDIDRHGNECSRTGSSDTLQCAKITCRKRGEQGWRHIYYVRADLADSNKNIENLFNFVNKRHFNTMLKSASYAIWDRTLTKMRRFVLQNSKSILQDDTGVPFDCYRKGWERYAFGSYTEPTLQIFKKVYKQPRMAEYFKKHMVSPIPFKIGYGFYQSKPNLLLVVPKAGEARSIDRDFGKTSGKKRKTEDVGTFDKAGVMRQVKELKDLKLQYKKEENCEENKEVKTKGTENTKKEINPENAAKKVPLKTEDNTLPSAATDTTSTDTVLESPKAERAVVPTSELSEKTNEEAFEKDATSNTIPEHLNQGQPTLGYSNSKNDVSERDKSEILTQKQLQKESEVQVDKSKKEYMSEKELEDKLQKRLDQVHM